MRVHKNNATGYTGILRIKNKYRVTIGLKQKNIYIGKFKTLKKAIQKRQDAELKYWGKIYTKYPIFMFYNKRSN